MDNNYPPQSYQNQPYPPQGQPYPPQPYGYPPASNTKSATTAGLLGIFLGQVGAHNWYLGEKNKGLIHSIIFGVCIILFIVIDFIIPANSYRFAYWLLSGGFWLIPLIGVIWSANAIWGLVEGIIILASGDAGLARKGYAVAAPVAPAPYPPQPYPAQPYPPQGQPYQQPPYPPYNNEPPREDYHDNRQDDYRENHHEEHRHHEAREEHRHAE